MSDDTPTQRFDVPPTTPVPAATPPDQRGSRRLIIILIIIGAVLLVAIIVILALLLANRGTTNAGSTTTPTPSITPSSTPSHSPSPTPTPTPTATQTGAPPPSNPNAQITAYSIGPSAIDCSATAPAGAADLSIKWSSVNGKTAYFGVGQAASDQGADLAGMGWTLPPSGTQHDFPAGYDPYEYQCGNTSQTYTITVIGTNGSKVSKTVTVSRK
ncbi:MAG: hypothetical protein V4479_05770 [Actinomycetota bacterium]